MDDRIAKAIRIGEENAVVIELYQNFCSNLEVERFGGTGLVEDQTGLPIGSRSFKCQYASAGGMAGMNLEMIALDFYDRNCKGCAKRIPVRLPNLSKLVADRDDAYKQQELLAKKQTDAKEAAYRVRREARDSTKLNCDEPTAGLIDAIDRLDQTGTSEAGVVLVELARVASHAFDPRVTGSLYSLAETQSQSQSTKAYSRSYVLSVTIQRHCVLLRSSSSRNIPVQSLQRSWQNLRINLKLR